MFPLQISFTILCFAFGKTASKTDLRSYFNRKVEETETTVLKKKLN